MTRLEPLRPQFHFSPLSGWMNDPNGLVCSEGTWHLFYQHHPDQPVWGPMHWGHAASPDGLHWQDRPIAMAPDDRLGMAFSGSALVDWQNRSGLGRGNEPLLAALLTHAGGVDGTQKQSLAVSLDQGESWQLAPDNPVLANPGSADFRDPKVFFHGESERFVMVLAVHDRVRFYASQDLRSWTFLSEFGAGHGSHGGIWECPDLFRLPVEGEDESRWVLQVDVGDGAVQGGSGGQYFVGSFDGHRFVPDAESQTVHWLDHGPDFYAFQSWSDLPGSRRVGLGWMSNWAYALKTPLTHWRGVMSVPRELSLVRHDGQVVLRQQPLAELTALRSAPVPVPAPVVVDGLVPLPAKGRELDIVLMLRPDSAAQCGIDLLLGENHYTRTGYNARTGELYVDRTLSGEVDFDSGFPGAHKVPVALESGDLELRILVDRTTIEVFAQGGRTVLSERVFPHPGDNGLRLFAVDGQAVVTNLAVYPMHSIWA